MLPEESPKLRHEEPGLLSMSVADRDKFGSHFHVTFRPNQQLDRFPSRCYFANFRNCGFFFWAFSDCFIFSSEIMLFSESLFKGKRY